jgi:hypothetical protein
LEMARFGVRRWPDAVGRPVLMPGHALTRSSSFDAVTVGVLPSTDVLMRRYRQYYDPLGLPLRSARFRLRLIRHALPRLGPRRRASPIPHLSLHTCHRPYPGPYPGETRRALRIRRGGRGLRRDMSGSTLPLFNCRGCNVQLMLRPACLLPPKRLSTPRVGHRDLSQCLGPATRRSDAYRDGTRTRWRSAAKRLLGLERKEELGAVVRTHHAPRSYPGSPWQPSATHTRS